ncbi:hypothetical protein CEXT_48141 [Caerostris extrusa]|uniref:Uncharacterized protein n=1 Tax=Caerostris extrusa TaxID=172846 RepID=A0AAV4WTM6_CAEEX|nr:hypothetical protein CEXT_48141 [Caerostris extrusa]
MLNYHRVHPSKDYEIQCYPGDNMVKRLQILLFRTNGCPGHQEVHSSCPLHDKQNDFQASRFNVPEIDQRVLIPIALLEF